MNDELAKLQGSWQSIRVVTASGPAPDEAARRLQYVVDRYRVTLLEDGKSVGTGVVAVDSTATTKTIDVSMSDRPAAGQSALGVYEVTSDRWRLCIGPQRPKGVDPMGAESAVELERSSSK